MRKVTAIGLAASAVVATIGQSARAAYTTTDEFVGGTLTGTNYLWSTNSNWSLNTPPTGSTLVTYFPATPITPQQLDTSFTAYGLALGPVLQNPAVTTVIAGATGSVLTLLSQDSTYDTTAKTAPAIYLTTQAETDLNMPIQLGDATTSSGTAHFVNNGGNGNSVMINNRISEAAGQSWGITIGGNAEIRFRGSSNSGNYVLNRATNTGKLTVLGSTNPGTVSAPTLRLVNNTQNYGIGLPNYKIDGILNRGTNFGGVIYNAVDGAGILGRTNGVATYIGANNQDGSFTGNIGANQVIYKIGSGTQSLGTGVSTATVTPTTVNAQTSTWVAEGAVSVTATSQLGIAGNALQLDGGGLTYVGPGETSTKAVNLSFRGGTITSSGSGPLVLSAASFGQTNVATAVGDSATAATSATNLNQTVQNMYGMTGLSAPAAAGKLVVSALATNQSAGTTIASGSTAITINETARTLDLGTGNSANAQTSGNGALGFNFTANAAIDRTLTLSGSNTGANTISGALTNEATFGAKLSVTKSGVGTWVLSGPNTYTGATTVTAGKLQLPGAAGTNALTNAGGVDIRGGIAQFDSSNLANIKSTLTAGYNQTTKFSAGQIRSSTLTGAAVLGYGDDGTNTTVRYTLGGDSNLDGKVDFNDFLVLQNNFNNAGTRFDQGNYNYDNVTDFNDFLVLQNNFGNSVTGAAAFVTAAQVAALSSFAATVPEPTSLALLGLGAAAAIRRRRSC